MPWADPFPDRQHLGGDLSLGIVPVRVAGRRHAARVDVVAQEDDELANRTERIRLLGQLEQHRLAVVGIAAGVAHEEERELEAVHGGIGAGSTVAGSSAEVQPASSATATARGTSYGRYA